MKSKEEALGPSLVEQKVEGVVVLGVLARTTSMAHRRFHAVFLQLDAGFLLSWSRLDVV